MEKPTFWWYLPGKMVRFMGYVSFREGSSFSFCLPFFRTNFIVIWYSPVYRLVICGTLPHQIWITTKWPQEVAQITWWCGGNPYNFWWTKSNWARQVHQEKNSEWNWVIQASLHHYQSQQRTLKRKIPQNDRTFKHQVWIPPKMGGIQWSP